MKTNPPLVEQTTDVEPIALDPGKLLEALYFVWDAFDRANVPFFLVNKTATDALAQKAPNGNKIEIGIRKNEWVSGGRRLLDAFMTPVSETPTLVTYEHNGIPIYMHVYEDSPCIIELNTFMYERENFSTPNPYSEFERIYNAA